MTSLEEFKKRLEESGLMSSDDITTFHESLPLDRRPTDAQGFARELVRQNNLTKLQAAAVYQGKTKNLVFGDYIVMDKIGAGGMGQVFSVRHRRRGGVFALKVLSSDAIKNPKVVKRFHREAQISSKLDHPNIVRTIEAGKMNQVSFLVMELVDGVTLRNHIKEHGVLSLERAVDCLRQAALGLAYAHKRGIVHRDVSPNNFLLDKHGTVKILDMGLARLEEEEDDPEAGRLTRPGQMLGTVQFMSPEHVEDSRFVDARSDVYSLGCTFHYFLAGRGPYKGETSAHTLLAHIREPIPSLKARRPEVPDALDAIFQKMLAKNREQRYQSVYEMLGDLHQAGLIAEPPPEQLRPTAAEVEAVNRDETDEEAAEETSFDDADSVGDELDAAAVADTVAPSASFDETPAAAFSAAVAVEGVVLAAPASRYRKPLMIAGGVLALAACLAVVAYLLGVF